MRLRTFESFWLIKTHLIQLPLLQNTLTRRWGYWRRYSGALISHALMQQGYDVLLLDNGHAREVGCHTSMLQYEVECRLQWQINWRDGAVLVTKQVLRPWRIGWTHQQQPIDCGFKSKKTIYLAHSKASADYCTKSLRCARSTILGFMMSPEEVAPHMA